MTRLDHAYPTSTALAGWNVGFKPVKGAVFEVYFTKLFIGQLDTETLSF